VTKRIHIKVSAIVPDDVDDFEGAEIEDFDRNNCTAWLIVSPEEIDADFIILEEEMESEFWGSAVREPYKILLEESCTWHGRDIINSEDVCWELEDMNL